MAKFLRMYDNLSSRLKSSKISPELYSSDLELLKKVCQRLTPLKPKMLIDESDSYVESYHCSNCESIINVCWTYCPFCSQKIKKFKI